LAQVHSSKETLSQLIHVPSSSDEQIAMWSFRNPLLVSVLSVMTFALKTKLEPRRACKDRAPYFVDGQIPWGCAAQSEPFSPDWAKTPQLPTVTVVCPTYSGRHRLHALLNHTFFSQTYPEEKLDLVILDDNTTEDSPLAEYWKQQSRVDYVRFEEAHSIGWKRNWLLQRAKGDMIVQFDDDDFYNKYYVRYMAEYLHEQQEVKLVQIVNWVNVYPTPDHWEQYVEERTFEAQCAEWPSSPFAFAWIYYSDVRSKCGFKDEPYKEELPFLDCLQTNYGEPSIQRIGDAHAQLIKVDTCAGSTSWGSISRRSKIDGESVQNVIDEAKIIAMYGQDAWSALNNLSLAQVDMSKCVGRHNVEEDTLCRYQNSSG